MQSNTDIFFPIANNNTHYSAFVNDPSYTFASQSFPNPPNPLLPLPGPSTTKQATLFDQTWLPVSAPIAPTPSPSIFPPEHIIPSFSPYDFSPWYGPMYPQQSEQLTTPTVPPNNNMDILTRSEESHDAPNPTKKTIREWERHDKLKNDEYVLSFTATRVKCAGCLKEIKLDSRDGARFYPGFWQRHKRRCKGVKNRIVSQHLVPVNRLMIFMHLLDCCLASQ